MQEVITLAVFAVFSVALAEGALHLEPRHRLRADRAGRVLRLQGAVPLNILAGGFGEPGRSAYKPAPSPHFESRHVPHPDHLRAALHQRRSSTWGPGGLDAAGRRLRAFQRARGPRDALHLRHRRARHAGRAGRRRGGPGPGDLLRRAARDAARPRPRASACPGTTSAARPRRRTTSSPSTSPSSSGRHGFIEERVDPAGLFDRRRALPARPLRDRHLPALRLRARRAATSARTAPGCWTRPT